MGLTIPDAFEEILMLGLTNCMAVVLTGVEVAEQPKELVTVTVKVPVVFTTMDEVVAPVLHRYPLTEPLTEAVSATDDPWQKDVDPDAEMLTPGTGFTVRISVAVLSQPPVLVVMKVYVPLFVYVVPFQTYGPQLEMVVVDEVGWMMVRNSVVTESQPALVCDVKL